MAIENFEEVKIYIEANKDNADVKDYVGGFITSDRVNSFLDGEDGKKLLQPKLDTYHAKGLDSWRANNLDKLYQERFAKENPTADPKDIAFKQLQAQFDKMQSDSNKKDLTNKALKMAQEKKLPVELVDFFVGSDEETTTKNLQAFESVFTAQVETLVLERLKGGYKPAIGTKSPSGKNPWSAESFNLTEQGKIFMENPELAKTLMDSAQ